MKLVIYDATDTKRGIDLNNDGRDDLVVPGLSLAWRVGSQAFQKLGQFDKCVGVSDWNGFIDAVSMALAQYGEIDEIQYWGHGWLGTVACGGSFFYTSKFEEDRWLKLQEHLADHPPHWWFRTCATFGSASGHHFAQSWSTFFNAKTTGHTAIIGTWGVHSHGYTINPGEKPHWSTEDGLKSGKPVNSVPWLPNTISCLQANAPKTWSATS